MSAKLMGLVFEHYPEGGNEMLLALKVADNAHEDGTSIYPSVATLARLTRQSERSVQYQIKRMTATGWLQLVRAARGGGRAGGPGRGREYRINPEWIEAHTVKPLEMGAVVAPISAGKKVQRVAPISAKGVQAGAEMGATAIAPKPSLTIKEPSRPAGVDNFERATVLCHRLKAAGVKGVRVTADLVEAALVGVAFDSLVGAIRTASNKGDPFAYGLKVELNKLREQARREEADQAAAEIAPDPVPRVVLTQQQLTSNKAKAKQAAALARSVLGGASLSRTAP